MKLLITGGCGFLGSNLAAQAMRRGDELLVFDNLSRLGSDVNLVWLREQGKFRYIHGDIRNQNDITRVVKEFKPNVIFHLAGQVAMTTSISDPRKDFEINVVGSHNLLEAVRNFSPESAVIYSSTNKVYGDLDQFAYSETNTRYVCAEHPNGFDEQVVLDFRSPYGCSKGAADQYMLDYARVFGLKTAVFRHSSMYGGRQFPTYDQGWVGWFCQKAVEASNGASCPFTISGTGKQVRDLLHADDMTCLYFSAAEGIENIRGMAFNVGGGMDNSLSILELFKQLEGMLNIKLVFQKLPKRTSDQKVFVADITRLQKTLQWTPRISADEGLRRMIEWVRTTL